MAGPNGSVWGDEVIVPPGQKIAPEAAAHVRPVGGDPTLDGDDTTNADGEDTKSTPGAPVVRLPDGSEVAVADYDPFAQQRQDLETREARVDGMMSVINGNGNSGNQNTGESDTGEQTEETHPLLADNPLLQKIELDPNDTLITEDDRQNAERHNNLVDYAKQQNEQFVKTITEQAAEHKREIDVIKETIGDRFVRDDIAQVTATTGVTEEELVAASRQTGVSDIPTLARIVAGEKAIQAHNEEAEQAAEAQREKEAGNITSTSQGSGGGGTQTQQKEGRGVENWRDAKSVGAAYKFGAVE